MQIGLELLIPAHPDAVTTALLEAGLERHDAQIPGTVETLLAPGVPTAVHVYATNDTSKVVEVAMRYMAEAIVQAEATDLPDTYFDRSGNLDARLTDAQTAAGYKPLPVLRTGPEMTYVCLDAEVPKQPPGIEHPDQMTAGDIAGHPVMLLGQRIIQYLQSTDIPFLAFGRSSVDGERRFIGWYDDQSGRFRYYTE